MKRWIVTICLAAASVFAATGQVQAKSIKADPIYKASTDLSIGPVTTVHPGDPDYELTGFGISEEFQINLLYQSGILDEDIDDINHYWVPMASTYNFPDHEEYILNISSTGSLTIYEHDGMRETVGGPEIKWTLTAWHQTILAGDIIDNGDGTITLKVLPEGTYRPFVNDPPVNDVEVFDGDLDCEVLGYTFAGTIGDIGDGSTLSVNLAPDTIEVPGDFATIQAAIDAAASGDTVEVAAGTYTESVVIDKALTLKSVSGPGGTVIEGAGASVVTISADDVTIKDLTITNHAGTSAIYAADRSSLSIINNLITDIGSSASGYIHAIVVVSASSAVSDVKITGNQITGVTGGAYGSASGISIGWSTGDYDITGLLIQNNTISNVTSDTSEYASGGRGAYGIILNHGGGVTGKTVDACILNNTITDLEGLWTHGIGLEGNTPGASVKGNVINNLTDHKSPTDAAAIMVEDNASADTVEISFNSFTNVNLGIQNVTALQVNARNNWWGTALESAVADMVVGDVDYVPAMATNQINMAFAAERLVSLQNDDGGWDWPLDDGDPGNESPKNTIGPIAMGLAKAYRATRDDNLLGALEKAGVLLLGKTNNFSPSDGYLAVELDKVFSGSTYLDHVNTNFYDQLEAGTYDRNGAGTFYDTQGYVDLIRTARASQGIANLACWDIAIGAVAAHTAGITGNELAIWINGVKAEIDELDGSEYYDVIGLAGGIYALAVAGEDFDPTAGAHASASNLSDLADILITYQLSTGGFTWNSEYVIENDYNETTQETSYAVLALAEMGGYGQELASAGEWLKTMQNCQGGFKSWAQGDENNEITAEAAWALGPWNTLELNADNVSLYVKPLDTVVIDMEVLNLLQKVNGCQAMLAYSSTYLGSGSVVAGGGVWDEVIYESWAIPGELDTAIGLQASGHVGTDADATVAVITLTVNAAAQDGTTQLVFRADDPDDETKQTILSDMDSDSVSPNKVDSQTIVVDGTPPVIDVTSASQNGDELLGTAVNAVQGEVTITITASDVLAGLDGIPEVTVTPHMGVSEDITATVAAGGGGIYTYTYTITSTTPNGTATINASVSDLAGNGSSDSDTFNINKNQIGGLIELDGFVGASRTVTFFATGRGPSKSWTQTLSFSGGQAAYVLTDVPAQPEGLSAKTAWNLRSKVSVTLDVNGQATGNFTGVGTGVYPMVGGKLRGGDLNGSNAINILDFSVLKINWYTTGPEADIDGSGSVSLNDFNIMKTNWFNRGDEE